MTVHEAATDIQRQTRCTRSYALFVAWRLWRHQKALKRRQERREALRRQAYFEEAKKKRFLERLRAARIITPAIHERSVCREGGWCIERTQSMPLRNEAA
jgi:hypothetical protein